MGVAERFPVADRVVMCAGGRHGWDLGALWHSSCPVRHLGDALRGETRSAADPYLQEPERATVCAVNLRESGAPNGPCI